MIVKLSPSEKKTLQSIDPKGSGPKPWQTAREVGGGVFRKKPENLSQEEIRVVRNSFRKLVREVLVEMNPADRGQYRITDRGRKLTAAGIPEFESKFQRGEATQAAKAAGETRMKERPRKTKAAPAKKAKAAKAAPAKAVKATPAKKAKKAKAAPAEKAKAVKATPAKKAKAAAPKITVEDKTDVVEAKEGSTNGTNGNGEHRKPKFKRRAALRVKNAKTEAAAEN